MLISMNSAIDGSLYGVQSGLFVVHTVELLVRKNPQSQSVAGAILLHLGVMVLFAVGLQVNCVSNSFAEAIDRSPIGLTDSTMAPRKFRFTPVHTRVIAAFTKPDGKIRTS